VERGTQLTRQLLAFTQRQVLRPRPVDVNALLGDMRRVLERVLGEDVRVVLEPSRETARVLADPGQLQQVVLNLVVNARDAMPGGGRILIATSVRPETGGAGEVVVEVADEGSGIPPEVMEHLFEPFFSTKEDGTGLGLASVYGIVKQHRGTVEVDPGPGRGATFRVRLPAVEHVTPAEVATPGLPPRGAGQHVLLVDDEASVRRAAERLLTRLGYHVTVAGSGDEALRIVQGGGRVDLVVTDVAMPGMNGSELVQRILELRPATPALFVSGYAQEFLSPELLEAGKLAFLPKPFSSEGLAEKIRELLTPPAAGRPGERVATASR
jgi:CheY-like chemotaxis protein